MQKIVPHLWFDKEAREAAEFYVSVFPESKIININTLHNTSSGDCDVVSFTIWGYEFMAISAGPYFKINPSISFSVNLETKAEVEALWAKLSPGGKVLMELGEYPWSKSYGWLNDKYGVSWQIIALGDIAKSRPKIVPALMFTQEYAGKAEAAMNYYATIFKRAKVGDIFRYTAKQPPDKEGTIAHAEFTLEGQSFIALDSAQRHDFKFGEGLSLIVRCEDQKDIDYYWQLSAVPESEQCGWLKDKYGVSWQVTPTLLDEMLKDGDPKKVDRVTQAFLKMKKFDLAKLKEAAA